VTSTRWDEGVTVIDIATIATPVLGDRTYLPHGGEVGIVVDPQRDIDRVLETVQGEGPDQIAAAQRQLVRIGIDRPNGAASGPTDELGDGHGRRRYRVAEFADLAIATSLLDRTGHQVVLVDDHLADAATSGLQASTGEDRR